MQEQTHDVSDVVTGARVVSYSAATAKGRALCFLPGLEDCRQQARFSSAAC